VLGNKDLRRSWEGLWSDKRVSLWVWRATGADALWSRYRDDRAAHVKVTTATQHIEVAQLLGRREDGYVGADMERAPLNRRRREGGVDTQQPPVFPGRRMVAVAHNRSSQGGVRAGALRTVRQERDEIQADACDTSLSLALGSHLTRSIRAVIGRIRHRWPGIDFAVSLSGRAARRWERRRPLGDDLATSVSAVPALGRLRSRRRITRDDPALLQPGRSCSAGTSGVPGNTGTSAHAPAGGTVLGAGHNDLRNRASHPPRRGVPRAQTRRFLRPTRPALKRTWSSSAATSSAAELLPPPPVPGSVVSRVPGAAGRARHPFLWRGDTLGYRPNSTASRDEIKAPVFPTSPLSILDLWVADGTR